MEYVLNENNDLISINSAQKKKEYKCIDTLCNIPVIYCNGDVRMAYFKHKRTCNCTCYNKLIWNQGESKRHQNAKYKLFEMLKNDDFITIKQPRKCINCYIDMSKTIKINTLGYKPHLEFSYNSTNKLKKLDVALNNDMNTIGFELCHTNKTLEINRMDIAEWYEFNADSINNNEALICKRLYNESNYKCSNCVNIEIYTEKQRILKLNKSYKFNKKIVLDELLNIEKEKQDEILNIEKEKQNKILKLEKIEKEKNEKIKLDELNKYQKQVNEENEIKQGIILKEERRIKNEERKLKHKLERKLERDRIKELVKLTSNQMNEYNIELVLDYLTLCNNDCCSYENLEKYNLLEYFNVL
tara:strand:+ start:40 stop:1110 length:1071 start_codon:yes stop_codon:yes gene_type:complete